MYGATDSETQVNTEVQQWFAAVDRDGSGRITATELKAALANGQGGTFSDTACRLMIGMFLKFNCFNLSINFRIFKTFYSSFVGMFDKEKSGTIDLYEFQALYNYINSWLSVFRGFDHDNSGSIQENELSAALTRMGYRLTPEFISFLIKKSDPNGHSYITIDQFIVLCVQIQRFTGKCIYKIKMC